MANILVGLRNVTVLLLIFLLDKGPMANILVGLLHATDSLIILLS
jgi:hypothetical protein